MRQQSISFTELSRRFGVAHLVLHNWRRAGFLKGAWVSPLTNHWRLPITEQPVVAALVAGKSPEEARAEISETEKRLQRREA